MALSGAVKGCGAGILFAALAGPSEAPAQPTPVGPEFQVNTYTTGYQGLPAVVADADGDFVVVWESHPFQVGGATSDLRTRGQRYDSAGNALGSEFQVNTYTASEQIFTVAADADGDLVVVWRTLAIAGLQGQRYDSTGSAVGSQFPVTSTGANTSSVAMDADGDFVAVWDANDTSGGDTSQSSIQGQRFDSAGTAVGSQFQVNTYTTGRQEHPSVAAHADGDFVVAWWDSDLGPYSIQGQRYDSAGTAVGGQFQASTFPPPALFLGATVAVAVEADHDFIVVWDSWDLTGTSGGDTDGFGVQGRRYDSAGSAVGGPFQVNTYTTDTQADPSVAATADGGFVVVWRSRKSNETPNTSVRGQHYDSAGNAVGGEFPISTYTAAANYRPSVAAGADGDFVVAWETNVAPTGDTSYASVHARRFTTAAHVPSLSPAALAAAALLVCLAALVALHRRVSTP